MLVSHMKGRFTQHALIHEEMASKSLDVVVDAVSVVVDIIVAFVVVVMQSIIGGCGCATMLFVRVLAKLTCSTIVRRLSFKSFKTGHSHRIHHHSSGTTEWKKEMIEKA